MTEKKKEPSSGPHNAHQGRISKNLHYSLHVVCQHVQAHLCADALKPFGEEVRCPHPSLEGTKRVLDRLPPDLRIPTIVTTHTDERDRCSVRASVGFRV